MATSTFTLRGRRGTSRHRPAFRFAGVALGVGFGYIDYHFVWHVWQCLTETLAKHSGMFTETLGASHASLCVIASHVWSMFCSFCHVLLFDMFDRDFGHDILAFLQSHESLRGPVLLQAMFEPCFAAPAILACLTFTFFGMFNRDFVQDHVFLIWSLCPNVERGHRSRNLRR